MTKQKLSLCACFWCFLFIGLYTNAKGWADVVSEEEVRIAATGWLALVNAEGASQSGVTLDDVREVRGKSGEILYYWAGLLPQGFIILSADTTVEPVIAFSLETSIDSMNENPLSGLLEFDLEQRIEFARKMGEEKAAIRRMRNLNLPLNIRSSETGMKWEVLVAFGTSISGETSNTDQKVLKENVNDVVSGTVDINDMRVSPMSHTQWHQRNICGKACFNYFTPPGLPGETGNYGVGCGATAMAQLLKFYQYPSSPNDIDPNSPGQRLYYPYRLDGIDTESQLLGGDGNGGDYQWSDMPDRPDCTTSELQRQAVGRLSYDAAVALGTNLNVSAGISSSERIGPILTSAFGYAQAVHMYSGTLNIGPSLMNMVNPNLDAGRPVLLSIRNIGNSGHVVLCDGYGYHLDTLYHHLNMGWSGAHDLWYNLPGISWSSNAYNYRTVRACIYNVHPSIQGEIISGRVCDSNDMPVPNTLVTLSFEERVIDQVYTNERGIYAFVGCASNTTFEVSASLYPSKCVTTGLSQNNELPCGNRWAVDFGPHSISGEVLFVDGRATQGNRDGSSWDHAFVNLQAAIDRAAISSETVKEIWVAHGTYRPDNGTGLRTLSFHLLDGIGLYGGFSGYENERDQRDPDLYVTVLSGDLNGDDDEADPNSIDDNSYHVINSIKNDRTAILDGFIVTGGVAEGGADTGSDLDNFGGGVFVYQSSPLIRNCSLMNNTAAYDGGGLYFIHASHPKFDRCAFMGNTAGQGGGMCGRVGSIDLEHCVVENNSAGSGGGAWFHSTGIVNIESCRFVTNEAVYGAGIYFNTCQLEIINSHFLGNVSGNDGAGLFGWESDVAVTNCVAVANRSLDRGGFLCVKVGSRASLINCTLIANAALRGPALYTYESTIFLANSILWDNMHSLSGDFIIPGWGVIQARHCCYQALYSLGDAQHCFDVIPGFVRPPMDGGDGWGEKLETPDIDESANDDYGDLHLYQGSLCIDSGSNVYVPEDVWDLDSDGNTSELIPWDLDANNRINSGVVDLGAYEF